MRKIALLLTVLLTVVTLSTSCKSDKDEPVSLTLGSNALLFNNSAGEQQTVQIKCNADWAATTDADWISVSPTTGEQDGILTVTVNSANNSTESREAIVTIVCHELSATLSVKQKGVSLTLGSSDLLFGPDANERQSVEITCDGAWSATTQASWIDVSPTNGSGNGTINISVNSSNNSSEQRQAEINVKCGDVTATIKVSQRAAYLTDCKVTPSNLVILGDAVGFEGVCGSKVSYFQWGTIKTIDANRLSDSEIVQGLNENERVVSGEYAFHYSTKLSPETDYTICIIAYGKDGNGDDKRGDLVKYPFKTKATTNQPAANISNFSFNGSKWSWSTTINPYAKEYYMMSITSTDIESVIIDDVVAAWYLETSIKEDPASYPSIIQSGHWTMTPTRVPYIYTMTWAKNQNGEWSGVIDSDWFNALWFSSAGKPRTQPKVSGQRGNIRKSEVRKLDLRIQKYN